MGELKQRVREVLERIKQEDKEINSFLWVNENAEREAEELERKQKKGRLFGKLIGVKANINVKGMPASCASQTLQRYIATYDASVVRKIKQEDGLIIGILNMDEFACGSSGETSAFGPTRNPVNREFVAGGSSSGSAAAVAAGFCDLALGSDTGGSVRNPASYCGVVGVKPSYGLVSRHGLIDLAMSLDQIGVCANSVADAALLLDVIRGQDPHDPTTFSSNEIKLNLKDLPKRLKVGWMSIDGLSPEVARAYEKLLKRLEEKNYVLEKVGIRNIGLALQAYYVLTYSEFFSSTRRFDGRRYGKKIEDVCGDEVLRRIVGGSTITQAEFEGEYYERAKKVKEVLKREFEGALDKVDCIFIPTVPRLPWKVGEGKKMSPEEIYASDALTNPVNLAECCAISIPVAEHDSLPIGMQVICKKAEEGKMFSIAEKIMRDVSS